MGTTYRSGYGYKGLLLSLAFGLIMPGAARSADQPATPATQASQPAPAAPVQAAPAQAAATTTAAPAESAAATPAATAEQTHKAAGLEHKAHEDEGYYSTGKKRPKKEYFSDNQKRHMDEGYYVNIKPYAPPPPEAKPVAPANAPPVENLPPPLVVPSASKGEDTGSTGSVTATKHAKEAKDALEAGQYEGAKRHFKESLKAVANQPDLYPGYWECCVKTNDWSEASRALEKLFELEPSKRPQYCWAYGDALFHLQRYEKAAGILKESLKYGKNLDEVHADLLKIAQQSRDNTAIAAEYAAIIRLHPGDFKAQVDFANLLELQGKHIDALSHYRTASNLQPTDGGLASRVAYMLMFYNKDYKGAINYYQKAMMADPANAQKYQDSIRYCQFQMQPAKTKVQN